MARIDLWVVRQECWHALSQPSSQRDKISGSPVFALYIKQSRLELSPTTLCFCGVVEDKRVWTGMLCTRTVLAIQAPNSTFFKHSVISHSFLKLWPGCRNFSRDSDLLIGYERIKQHIESKWRKRSPTESLPKRSKIIGADNYTNVQFYLTCARVSVGWAKEDELVVDCLSH